MKKIMQVFCAAVLSFSMFALNAKDWLIVPVTASGTCTTVEECDAAKEALVGKKAEIQGKIDSAKTDASMQYEALYAIREKTGILESEIDLLQESIVLLQAKEVALSEQIKATEDALLSRYKMQQSEGTTNPFLYLLVNSKSVPDLLRKWQIMGKFNLDDANLVEKVTQQRVEILATQEQQTVDKASIEVSKTELGAVEDELQATLAQMIQKQAELEATMEDVQFSEAEIDKQKDAAQAYKDQIDKEQEEANKPKPKPDPEPTVPEEGGGGETAPTPDPEPEPTPPPKQNWYNPMAGNPIPITCPIGCYNGHIGVDFGAYYTNIYSIARGKVIYASGGWNGGFGTMAVIYHYVNGVDYVTIYGHLSELYVYTGQEVGAMQTIGISGNTGTSTGPHLHLELVRDVWYYPSRWEREAHGLNVLNYIPGGFVYW